MMMTLDPDRVTSQYLFCDTVLQHLKQMRIGKTLSVARGEKVLSGV